MSTASGKPPRRPPLFPSNVTTNQRGPHMAEAALATPAPEPETTEIPAAKPFGAFLHEHREAGLHNELGEGLAKVVAAAPSDINGAVVVTDAVEIKAPKPVP